MIIKLIKACKEWLEGKISKPFDSFFQEHYKLAPGILVLTAPLLWLGLKHSITALLAISISVPAQLAGVSSSSPAIGGTDHNVLGGTWSENNHEIICDHDIVQLKRDALDAIIDYDEQIPLGQSAIEFTIIPTGKNAHNVGYGRHTLYEFMFGDGDKSKISLKYDLNQDGTMEFIPLRGELAYSEAAQGIFIEEISNLTEIKVRVEERIVSNSKIQLLLVINEKYTFTSDALLLVNAPVYKRVYISLVDYSGDGKNETAAQFPGLRICPLQ
jgi:hypothetical protein